MTALLERVAFAINILKGDSEMMAMFFAQRVILGKTAYKDVPAALKAQVAEILTDSGLGDLVTE